MGRTRGTVMRAAVVIAVSIFGGSLVWASNAAARTTGFHVRNLTSTPLELTSVKWVSGGPDKSDTAPPLPKVGDVLAPGEFLQIEIAYDRPREGIVELRYRTTSGRLDRPGEATVTLYDFDPKTPGRGPRTARCDGSLQCNHRAGAEEVGVVQPPNTGHDAGADDPQLQRDLLRSLCSDALVEKGFTRCEFRPTGSHVYGPRHLAGTVVANCYSEFTPYLDRYSDNIEPTNSLGIPRGRGTESIFEAAKAGSVYPNPEFFWLDRYFFRGTFRLVVDPGYFGWTLNENPLNRHTGSYLLVIGNTTWRLNDVYFDTPDNTRDVHPLDSGRLITPEEREKVCNGEPGVIPVPRSYALAEQRGTPGADALYGGGESTTIRALAGDDTLRGAGGDDTLIGGPGADKIFGGPGSDMIVDASGATRISTGGHRPSVPDTVDVRDGRADDIVRCASPETTVRADRRDRVRGC